MKKAAEVWRNDPAFWASVDNCLYKLTYTGPVREMQYNLRRYKKKSRLHAFRIWDAQQYYRLRPLSRLNRRHACVYRVALRKRDPELKALRGLHMRRVLTETQLRGGYPRCRTGQLCGKVCISRKFKCSKPIIATAPVLLKPQPPRPKQSVSRVATGLEPPPQPLVASNKRQVSKNIAVYECGGGGRCGWLSLNALARRVGNITVLSDEYLKRNLVDGRIPTHIVLTALREMYERPALYPGVKKFIKDQIRLANAAARFVKTHSLDADTGLAYIGYKPIYSRASVYALNRVQVQVLANWIARTFLYSGNRTEFDENFALLYSHSVWMLRDHITLVSIAKTRDARYEFQHYSALARDSRCIFLYNDSNVHWQAASYKDRFAIPCSEVQSLFQ